MANYIPNVQLRRRPTFENLDRLLFRTEYSCGLYQGQHAKLIQVTPIICPPPVAERLIQRNKLYIDTPCDCFVLEKQIYTYCFRIHTNVERIQSITTPIAFQARHVQQSLPVEMPSIEDWSGDSDSEWVSP